MSDWLATTLGELCDLGGGEIRTGPFGSQLHEADYSFEGVPVIMPKDITAGRVDVSTIARVSSEHVDRLAQHKLGVGDIVYGRRGDIGRKALITDREAGWLCGTGCLRVTIGDQSDSRFLFYRLGHPDTVTAIQNRAVGATMPNLNTTILREVELTVPDLETQRRIASILGSYDDLIEVNRRRVAVLTEMARGLFEEWFVRFRFPGYESVPIIETAQGPLPQGWTWGAFCNLAPEVRDTVSPSEVPRDLPYVGLEHIPRRSTTLDDHGKASDATSLKARFRRGDILFGKIRPYFHKVAWAPFSGVASTDAIIWRPDPRFAAQALAVASSDSFVAHAVQSSNGTKMPRANPKVLAAYRCALASAYISQQYEAVAAPMNEMAAGLQAANVRLAASRDLLLPKLISGRISVESAQNELEQAA